MKKLVSLVIVMALVMSLAVGAAAASITITPNLPENSTSSGETYTAYKIFDATISGENVAYTIDSTNPFFTTIQEYKYNNIPIFSLDQVNSSTTYNVTIDSSFDTAAVADLATKLNAVTTKTVEGTNTAGTNKIENLDTGYYLVTSSLGSALIVETLKDSTVNTKNAYPTLTKKVINNNTEADSTTADRGATVTFKITVNIPATVNGDIIIHDTLDTDMTYVELTDVNGVTKVDTCGVNGCTSNVHFKIDRTVVTGTSVSFNYTATVNATAATATAHTNTAILTYSAYTSASDSVDVYTYQIDVKKWTGNENTGLAGAGFVLKNAEGKYYINTDGIVSWGEEANATEYKTTDGNFTVSFVGLANGSYTLSEKTVPEGYNPAEDVTVTVNGANVTQSIENKSGTVLPSTGGMGTTIFYVLGGLMFVGALVLLVTNKRMKAE